LRNTHARTSMLRLAAGVVATITVTAACGGGGSKSTAGTASSSTGSGSGGTLIIGMTASDIPQLDTVLAGGQGYEGDRFVGNQLYDGFTKFDLKQSTEVPKVVPDLAESWTVTPDASTWTFKLRPGVTFHDGTPWNADAAVFNFDRFTNKQSPYYSATLGATAGLAIVGIKTVTKVDDLTIEIDTNGPDAHLPSDLTTVYMASPTAVKKDGNDGFANNPVGTGPFKFVSVTRGQRLELTKNESYWAGAPKLDKLILRPIPDATARVAAIRSGEVNWIEVPPPDDVASLKGDGFQILTNQYDHIWPWIFDTSQKPWNDVRVRQAAEYAINRDAMAKTLLHDTAQPAAQLTPPANASYSKADDMYGYDPAKAKQLLADAGYPNGFKATVSIPTSGSGNMIPIPMNEELQRDLGAVGIQVELKPIEWAAMLQQFAGGKFPDGASAVNISLTFQAEATWSLLFNSKSPINIGKYANPVVDQALTQAAGTLDDAARNKLYEQASAQITKDAAWLVVVNDLNPRALSPKVHGFIQPKSWFADLTTVSVGSNS